MARPGGAGPRGSSQRDRHSQDAPRPASRSRRAASQANDPSEDERGDRTGKARNRQHPAITARKAAQCAAEHVAGLTGQQAESVTSLERTDDGWLVGIEVVESHRIPDSTDILAVYRVELDDQGELVSYRRAERYYRGRAEEQ